MARRLFLLSICLMSLLALALSFSVSSAANTITNIQVTPEWPDVLASGTRVTITFDYETDEVDGAYIYFRPFSAGSLSGGYSAHGGISVPQGSGSGEGWFDMNQDYTTVDQIRAEMWNDAQDVVLLETFVSVLYYYGPTPVTNIVMTPESPAALLFGDFVNITFDYEHDVDEGVRIYPRPMITGGANGGYSASGSPLYAVGSGSGSGHFTVKPPETAPGEALQSATVNEVRFQIKSDDQTYLIAEFYVPVSYTFDSTVATRETTWGRIKALYSTE